MSEDRDAFEAAADLDCHVVEPLPNELFVDIDDEASALQFSVTLAIMNRDRARPWTFRMTPSPSGQPHHFHTVVIMDEPVTDERIRLGLQAMFGSDRVREALGWQRVRSCDTPVTCFFEKNVHLLPAPERLP